MWLAIQSRGFWLTSADRFLVEIAATLMARYRTDELKSGDLSLLIGVLGKIGLPCSSTTRTRLVSQKSPPFSNSAARTFA
jgi:hypothetical protein